MKRYVVERTSKAEIRPEEQSEKAESFREGLNDRNRHKNRIKRSGQAQLVYVKNINGNIPHRVATNGRQSANDVSVCTVLLVL